ncbi:MAG: N-acetyltransferase family protein [Pseudomonadota bacterium]
MILRSAVVEDAAAVAAIWNALIRDSLVTFTTQEKTPSEMGNLIALRPDAFFVVSGSNSVLGFATFGTFRGGPGYATTVEHTVMLDPAARGLGQGRRLMNALMTAAHQQGVHVMIAAISSANPDAVQFHERLGFAKTGHLYNVGYKSGQWLDLIFMQKTLGLT